MESIAADIGRGLHHARLYETEKRLVEELRSIDEMKTEFFTTVAHELRSPLASIEGYIEMLSDGDAGPITDTQHGMLAAVTRGAGRLRNLVDDLLTLARLESSAERPATTPVDLAEVVTRAADTARPPATAAGLTLTVSSPRSLIVAGDPSQLEGALTNLLSNAVKSVHPVLPRLERDRTTHPRHRSGPRHRPQPCGSHWQGPVPIPLSRPAPNECVCEASVVLLDRCGRLSGIKSCPGPVWDRPEPYLRSFREPL